MTDQQLALVMAAASALPVEKRAAFLPRVAGRLELRSRFADADPRIVLGVGQIGVLGIPAVATVFAAVILGFCGRWIRAVVMGMCRQASAAF